MSASLEAAAVLALAVTSTFAAGLEVRLGGLRQLAPTARPLLLALAGNFVGIPVVLAVLVRLLGIDGPVALGLLIASAAPGGSTGPLLAMLAGAEMATAVVLFTSMSLVAAFVTPLLLLLLGAELSTSHGVAWVFAGMLAGQLAPLAAGLCVRRMWPRAAERLRRPASRLGLVLLVAVVVGLAVRHGDLVRTVGAKALVAAALTSLVALGVGAAARSRQRGERVAIAQVSAIRNLTLALLVTTFVDGRAAAALAVLVYGLVMYAVAGSAALLSRRTAS